MDVARFLGALALSLAVLVYGLLPLLVWRRFRMTVPSPIDEVDLSSVSGGPQGEAKAYLEAREGDMRALGFAPLGTFSLVMSEGTSSLVRLFRHAETGDGATAIATILERGRGAPRVAVRAQSFATRLADGPELVTTDRPGIDPFTPPSWRRTVQAPEAPDAATLRRIHVGVAHASGMSRRPRAEPLPRPIESLARACREAIDAAIAAGELAHDGRAGQASFTLRGAYRFMWGRYLPPGRWRRERERKAALEEALREAGERL